VAGLTADVLQVAVTVWLPGVTVNAEDTQTWALAVSGRARKKAAEISNKSVAAWGNDLMSASLNLPKGLRMGVRFFRGLATSYGWKTVWRNCNHICD